MTEDQQVPEDKTLNLTLQGPDHLIAHILGLQQSLTNRNALIANLRDQLGLAENGEPQQRALKKAYNDGWKACASELSFITREAALRLRSIDGDAFQVYLKGDQP